MRRINIPNRQSVKWNIETLRLAWLAHVAFVRACRIGLRGKAFYKMGRCIGWKLWRLGYKQSRHLLMSPVSITRYFEFDFTDRHLRDLPEQGLAVDVSSPFLFSFGFCQANPRWIVRMINPDGRDLKRTVKTSEALKLSGLETIQTGYEILDQWPTEVDVIWSISVIEHISEEHGGDIAAVQAMWKALKPGGVLIITVPTDKQAWVEYRKNDPYELKKSTSDARGYFFQQFYDESTIKERIISTIGCPPVAIEWFGVNKIGHFHQYIQTWLKNGTEKVVWHDPLDIAENYQSYSTFEEMPGEGVCGLCFKKPNNNL